VTEVHRGTPAWRAGVRKGDLLLTLNGEPLRDVIDYMYGLGEEEVTLLFKKAASERTIRVTPDISTNCGVELAPPRPKVCRNKCVFCFVAQLPKGLRRTLYVRDEDYRLSFLYGNYITLTNLSEADRARIIHQRLSPLYISVHSVDPEVRKRLLGREDLEDIVPQLERFIRHGIRIHAQVVLCPGINDRADLEKTIGTLAGMRPGVDSLAVVPVGLTAFHRQGLRPVDGALARYTVRQVSRWQKRLRARHGDGFVYCSDEMFLLAGLNVPSSDYYDDFAQIENGVGLIREFLDRFEDIRFPRRLRSRTSLVLFTGVSFYPFLKRLSEGLEERVAGLRLEVVGVSNRLLGERVTVAGLLSGRDIVEALKGKEADAVLVPSVVLRDGDGLFLDDMSVSHLESETGLRTLVVDPSPEGLLQGMQEVARWPRRKSGRKGGETRKPRR